MTPPDAKTRARHRIGGYRVIAPIGAGGFATVYRALDENTGSEVAIKVLAENHSLVPNTRRRFVDEVGLLATIDSPAIAKIYELGETDTGQPFMVLELADRGDLRRRLEEIRGIHRILNRTDLTRLADHLYEALTTLHDADIVHRDVSPGNILIKSNGQRVPSGEDGVTLLEAGERLLLADLGHAKDLILASGFTAGGGTRGYASPEQRDDVTVVDHRADIFSATAVMEWAAHDGMYADRLEPFFDVGLAEEPDDRFDSMTEWHVAFGEAMGEGDTTTGRKRTFGGWNRFRAVCGHVDGKAALMGATSVAAVSLVAFVATTQLGGDGSTIAAGTINPSDTDADSSSSRTTEAPAGLLLVKDAADEVDPNEPAQPASTDGSSTSATTSTSAAAAERPMTQILSPEDGSVSDGDLTVSGAAQFAGGLKHVEILVTNVDSGLNWNPQSGEFEGDWLRFPIPVSRPNNTEMTWQFSIPSQQLAPGNYLIRAWARGSNGEGDPQGHSLTVQVN